MGTVYSIVKAMIGCWPTIKLLTTTAHNCAWIIVVNKATQLLVSSTQGNAGVETRIQQKNNLLQQQIATSPVAEMKASSVAVVAEWMFILYNQSHQVQNIKTMYTR